MLQVKQVTTFQFSIQAGETTFNFTIPAETQQEACQKLIAQLNIVLTEVKAILKPGSN
jgi:hypothetical protein